ncbi:MAG: POTRA domain-containing protein [Flavobacteriaceae bacterium]
MLFFHIAFSQNIHLKLEGQDSISNNYIKTLNYKTSFKNTKTLQEELTTLQQRLLNYGYFNNIISPPTKINNTSYTTKVNINKHYENISISYTNTPLNKTSLLDILTPNTEITNTNFICKTSNLETNLNNIITHLTETGQLFSSCQLTNIDLKNSTVFAKLNLTTTTPTYISKIKLKGYEKFPKKFIKHYLKLKPGQILNLNNTEQKSNHLNHLKFASEIKKPEILFTKDSATVYLYPNKTKANHFEGFIGFSTNPDTEKLDINGNIDLKLINNLNSGEEIYFKYQSTENLQKRIFFKAAIPYIFNTPFSIEGDFEIFKKDSSFTNNTQSIQLKYNLNKNISIGAGVRFNTSNSLTENNTTNIDFKKTSQLLSFNHRAPNTQSNFFTTKTKTLLEFTLTKRKTALENNNQQNIFLTSEYIFQINRKNSFFIKNQSNYLISNTTFSNEQLYIGGINSIRGYQENSIPSTQYSILNTEYRITLNNNLYTHTVIDYAITKAYNENSTNNLFGFGLGFGLRTNNSLLRFIIANKKNKEEDVKFSESKIHLSLSTIF